MKKLIMLIFMLAMAIGCEQPWRDLEDLKKEQRFCVQFQDQFNKSFPVKVLPDSITKKIERCKEVGAWK